MAALYPLALRGIFSQNETDVFHHHEMAITEDHWGFHYEVVDQALRLSYYPWDDTF
jgi:hypothetical protein